MKASQLAVEIIKEFEGCRLKAYLDSKGKATIGYGTIMYADGSRVRLGDAITLDQANKLLLWQIELKAIAVDKMLKPYVVTQTRFDVLISFTYNLGINALEKSTLLRMIKKNPDDPKIADEFLKWVNITENGKLIRIQGLVNRRRKEVEVWFG